MFPKFKKPNVPMHPMGMSAEKLERPTVPRHGNYEGNVKSFEHTVGGFNKAYGPARKVHKRF